MNLLKNQKNKKSSNQVIPIKIDDLSSVRHLQVRDRNSPVKDKKANLSHLGYLDDNGHYLSSFDKQNKLQDELIDHIIEGKQSFELLKSNVNTNQSISNLSEFGKVLFRKIPNIEVERKRIHWKRFKECVRKYSTHVVRSETNQSKWKQVQERFYRSEDVLSHKNIEVSFYQTISPTSVSLKMPWKQWCHKLLFDLFYLNTKQINVNAHEQIPSYINFFQYKSFVNKLDQLITISEKSLGLDPTHPIQSKVAWLFPRWFMYVSQNRLNIIYMKFNLKKGVRK